MRTRGDLCSPFFGNFSERPCMKVFFYVRSSPWEIKFLLSSKTLPLLARNSLSGPVNMFLGQLIASGQLTDPGVDFASVYGLTSVIVHMNLSFPRGNFEGRVTYCTIPGNRPCQSNFSPCEQNSKVAPGGKSSLAHAHY